MSGAWRKASLFKGLKRPEAFKFFSTTVEISEPIFFLFKIFSKLFFEFSSIDYGETAIGRGFKLPLVISTSIKAFALIVVKNKTRIIKNFFILNILPF